MQLQKIVVLCLIGIIIICGGWYLLSQDEDGADTTERELSDADEEVLSGQGSIRDLFGMGRNIRCEYTYNEIETGMRGSGVSYIAGQRLRVDSDLVQDGQTFESHVINDGENLWTWTQTNEGMFAFVTNVDETDTNFETYDSDTPSVEGNANTLEDDVEYSCRPWNVDASIFVPPSDIEFSNPTQMMNDAMQNLPSGTNEEMQQMLENMWSE
jgi:hypothetical protein